MSPSSLINLSPLAQVVLVGGLLSLIPLVWIWVSPRNHASGSRLRTLTAVTLVLTFDLVLFGAFTRLTDSGLGCPDWPGCYGSASPLGAAADIHAAQSAMPTGPVTKGKAWIEMIHRYLATGVGALIVVMTIASWMQRRKNKQSPSPWWPSFTLCWVCLQGAFGALTVTMKLYPAIVTLHLLGGIGLLALLAVQTQHDKPAPLTLSRNLYLGAVAVAALSAMQIVLGGWVSTNYAVLACTDFPKCQGSWWPPMDFDHGFTVMRELGAGKDGGYLPFAALTAIHMVHRIGAAVVFAAMALLVWQLHADAQAHNHPPTRRWAHIITAVAVWQLVSGLSNVVLGWPLIAAVAHTGGAAALITLMTVMLTRAHQAAQVDLVQPAVRGRRSAAMT